MVSSAPVVERQEAGCLDRPCPFVRSHVGFRQMFIAHLSLHFVIRRPYGRARKRRARPALAGTGRQDKDRLVALPPVKEALFAVAIVAGMGLLVGCSHQCKSNSDCPTGDTCRAENNNISPTMACGPCVVVGLECTSNSDCCSGNCPSAGNDEQVCKPSADAGPSDGGGAAHD